MAGLLNPKSFVEGGSFDDFDGIIVGAKFVRTDYAGKRTDSVPALCLTFRNDEDADGKPFDQHFSVGKAEDWAPSADGETLLAIGKKTALNGNSNTAILFRHMEAVGVPEDLLDAASLKISALVGFKAHWNNVPIKREIGGESKDTKVLVPTALIALPGETAAAAVANPLMSLAIARVGAYIDGAKKKTVNKADLVSLVLGDTEVPAESKNEVIKLVIDDSFLTAGPWTYAGGALKG